MASARVSVALIGKRSTFGSDWGVCACRFTFFLLVIEFLNAHSYASRSTTELPAPPCHGSGLHQTPGSPPFPRTPPATLHHWGIPAEAQGAAKVLGIEFLSVEVKGPNPNIEGAFRTMLKERLGALVTEAPPLISFRREKILQLAPHHRIPGIYPEQAWAEAGGLMSYGANRVDPYRRVTLYIDKILRRAKPGDLPVEQPTKFELVINIKTAKQINVTIPPNVLARADRVIK
jgi:hypothetical protein